MFQGLGISVVHVALNVMAFATLAPDLRPDGAALINLLRNIGGSIGVAHSPDAAATSMSGSLAYSS